MKTKNRIIFLVGLSLIIIMFIVTFSLDHVMNAFSSITKETDKSLLEIKQIEKVARELTGISSNLQHYITTRNNGYRTAFEISRDSFYRELTTFDALKSGRNSDQLSEMLHSSYRSLEQKAGRIFSLQDPVRRDRVSSVNLLLDVDNLIEQMTRDIEAHNREERSLQLAKFTDYFQFLKIRVLLLFLALFVASAGFLVSLAIYIHRKVAAPLNVLRKGANEISRGNLDHRVAVRGTSDINDLAAQFNDMAQKLNASYADLEQKLLERTHALSSIDSVALTLSGAGTLKSVLNKSLQKMMDSLTGIEPKGGVFLCNADGEHLDLITQIGLSTEFVEAESRIRMGECLCGLVAQTGEMLFTQNGCNDPRHTRQMDAGPHAHIIIPIKSRGIVLGVVFLYPARDFVLKPTDIQMLDAMGAQLGLAVENFRFYAEVKQSSEKYWDLFENSRDILFTIDTRGTMTAVNKMAEQFSGYSKIELVGKNIMDFLTDEGVLIIKSMLAGRHVEPRYLNELEVIKRDGTRAFVDFSARKLYNMNSLVGYQVSTRDMTEQKNMREMVLRAERIGAIAQVGIAVRHEINNPLTTVIGNIELLMERYENKDPALTARLEVILNNSLRIAEITKRLQEIKKEKVVDYLEGVKMTDLKYDSKENKP